MGTMKTYDVVIIGSGPGGYVAAIRCAQLGMKTAIVERYATLGGTCLNVGCIPSKAMLDSSEHYHNAISTFQEHGIRLKEVRPDFTQMIKRTAGVVKQTTDGVQYLMKKNKVDVFHGHARFESPKKISIKSDKGTSEEIEAAKVIIATGSKPATIKGVEIDKKRIITSTEGLVLKELPKSLIVIGGGAIGLEMGSVFARLGTKVTVVEYMDRLIPGFDMGLSRELLKVLKNLKIEFHLKHQVTSVTASSKKGTLKAKDEAGKETSFEAEYCLVAVGRKPYTDQLGLDRAGLKTDEKGRIPVNDQLETSVPGIFAIGDVVRGAMLAHKAEDEGSYVAEVIAGQKPHINYLLIPNVVYTWPEVAAVGYTEEQLKEMKRPYKSGSFPFKASGRARASMDIDGFVKVLADKETDEILGVHMIGPRAADMISEAVVAMEFRASAEDIGRICHAHPTYTESFKDACLAASENRAINI
jgi:dihydrolipoamide dehydrogenase